MRTVVAHQYERLDYDSVSRALAVDMPTVTDYLAALLESPPAGGSGGPAR